RAHHGVLRRAKFVAERINRLTPRFLEEKATASLAPLGALMPPGVAPTLEGVATAMALEKIGKEPLPDRDYNLAPSPIDSPAPPPPPSGWTPEWRQISVSFVAGVIVAALLSLQLREIRKRKPDSQPASKD